MLSKAKLIERISNALVPEYQLLPGRSIGAAAQLFRPVRNDVMLSLGIELSTRYKGRFTGSFYLSRSFAWAYLPSWFPREAYRRVGHFLTAEEREQLLDAEFRQPGVVDAWWWADEEDVSRFGTVVRRADERFVNEPGLIEKLRSNESLDRYILMLDAVSRQAGIAEIAKDVPSKWVDAAGHVLRESSRGQPKTTLIRMVATDAWRRAVVLSYHGDIAVVRSSS